jgi:hypothetical protein
MESPLIACTAGSYPATTLYRNYREIMFFKTPGGQKNQAPIMVLNRADCQCIHNPIV